MAAKEPEDTIKQFAEALRSKGGIENRPAVLGGVRYELFRAKDLARWVKAHPDKAATAAGGKGGEGDELAKFLGQQLLRRRLVARVDRLNKKPLPGSKKLVKFPRKLAAMPAEQAAVWAEDGFFVWMYQRPTSPWLYVWAAVIPLVVLGGCLFPLAPNWAKLGVFYLSAGLLIFLLGLLLLRSVVALASWLASGRTVWLLPNIMSEELPITKILKPLVSVEGPAEGASKWSAHPLTRLGVAAATAGLLYTLYSHSPDKASMATEASRYKDDLMDWLGVQQGGYHRLAGNGSANGTANATAADAAPADGTAAGAGLEEGAEAGADLAAEGAAEAAGDEEAGAAAEAPAAGEAAAGADEAGEL